MSASEDQADVEDVLAGNVSAFEGIVRRWQGPLINLAYRFCRDRGRAEEMAQMTFLKAYRALASWRKDSAFSTWLFALAMNLYRSELHRLPPAALSLDQVPEPGNSAGFGVDINGQERDREVRRAVFTLPSKYREPVVLFYFHEMNVAAVAGSLGLPDGTVKARLFRAREILRDKLRAAQEGK